MLDNVKENEGPVAIGFSEYFTSPYRTESRYDDQNLMHVTYMYCGRVLWNFNVINSN